MAGSRATRGKTRSVKSRPGVYNVMFAYNEEKVGLMFQTVIEAGEDGTVIEEPGRISKSPTSVVVLDKHLSHFNVHVLEDARMAARWHNTLQAIAERSPHGIPVTISTDPRHAFIENAGVSFSAKAFSQWP